MDNIANLISNVVNQFIVTPTTNLIGIDGFIFDIIDDEDVIAETEITDHYVEDNYAIEDHIALKPVIFTLRGFVGEISNSELSASEFTKAASDIALVSAFLPVFTTQAQQVYDKITQQDLSVSNVINTASSVYGLYTNYSTTSNKQQNAFNYFKALRDARILCQVETPYGVFQNMAILRLQAVQKGDTKLISDFMVTFKEIKTVNSVLLAANNQFNIPDANAPLGSLTSVFDATQQVTTLTQMKFPVSVTGQTTGQIINQTGGSSVDSILSVFHKIGFLAG